MSSALASWAPHVAATRLSRAQWEEVFHAVVVASGEGLGLAPAVTVDEEAHLGDSGAMLTLTTDDLSLALEVSGESHAIEKVARGLLMMEPDEEIDWEDVLDAVREVANVIAGALKTELIETYPTLTLGLPHSDLAEDRQPRLRLSASMVDAPVTVALLLA
ncbi:MAG: chemotaxis protein CheX [Sandaracinaceae bacterium]